MYARIIVSDFHVGETIRYDEIFMLYFASNTKNKVLLPGFKLLNYDVGKKPRRKVYGIVRDRIS